MKEEGITLKGIKKKFDNYFSPACLIHDVCLGTQRYIENGKESCDLDFKFNTGKLCELEGRVSEFEDDEFLELPRLRRKVCKAAQKTAYLAVVSTKARFYDIVREGCL